MGHWFTINEWESVLSNGEEIRYIYGLHLCFSELRVKEY